METGLSTESRYHTTTPRPHFVFLPSTTSSFVQPLRVNPAMPLSREWGCPVPVPRHRDLSPCITRVSRKGNKHIDIHAPPLPPLPITAHCHTSTTDDKSHQQCPRPRRRSCNTARQQLHRRAAGGHSPHPTTNVPRRPARRLSIASPDGCAPPRQHRASRPRASRQTSSLARRPCPGACFSCRRAGPPPPPRRAGARSRRTSCRHRLRHPSVCAPSTLWTMG